MSPRRGVDVLPPSRPGGGDLRAARAREARRDALTTTRSWPRMRSARSWASPRRACRSFTRRRFCASRRTFRAGRARPPRR